MSEKVVLPKEVAEAIEHTRCWSLDSIQSNGRNNPESYYGIIDHWIMNQYEDRDGIKMYFSALVNGYEVEQSPEDKLREYYNRNNPKHTMSATVSNRYAGRRDGVRETLDILGITIEGVNAE